MRWATDAASVSARGSDITANAAASAQSGSLSTAARARSAASSDASQSGSSSDQARGHTLRSAQSLIQLVATGLAAELAGRQRKLTGPSGTAGMWKQPSSSVSTGTEPARCRISTTAACGGTTCPTRYLVPDTSSSSTRSRASKVSCRTARPPERTLPRSSPSTTSWPRLSTTR